MLIKRDTIPAPYVVLNTGVWDGDDGKWSSFAIELGAPPQSVRVLPNTVSSLVTVPFVQGCQNLNSGCGQLRGIDDPTKIAYYYNESSAWSYKGVFDLFPQQDIYRPSGLYGDDTVQIGRSGDVAHNASVASQLIAGMSASDFWVGSIGLGDAPLSVAQVSAPSLLSNLKNQSVIPSLSYAYTAGQYYNNRPGSLILGGLDQAKVSPGAVTFNIDPSKAALSVKVQSITSTSSDGSTTSYLSNPLSFDIDTSFNQMWLPNAVCDAFITTFGLIEDEATRYFRINQTQHAFLQSSNPSISFTMGGQTSSSTTTIVLDYHALDMQIGYPVYTSDTPYFPIRRAVNETQLTLGRAFLQEAYLVVDWERNNFTIGGVKQSSQTQIVAIPTVASSATATATSTSTGGGDAGSSSGIGAGAIAGIVIAMLALIAAIVGGILFYRRRRRRQREEAVRLRQSIETQPPEYDPTGGSYFDPKHSSMSQVKSPGTDISELYDSSRPRAELTSDNVRKLEELAQQRELMSTPILELEGDRADSELDGTNNKEHRASGLSGAPSPSELDGSTTRGDRTSGLSGVVSPLRNSVTTPPDRVRSPLSMNSVYEME